MSPNVLLSGVLAGAGPAAISILGVGVVGMGIVDSIQNITDEEGETSPADDSAVSPDSEDDAEAISDGGDLEELANDDSALDSDDDDAAAGAEGLAEMGGGGSTAELENRVDTVEEELERLSSTMSTVRSENEEISDAVDEVQENVRQLLEIYEMVTRGVNPFVDEAPDGAFGGGDAASGSIGVFDDEEEADPETEGDLDEDVVDADAEAFFDDAIDDEPDSDTGEADPDSTQAKSEQAPADSPAAEADTETAPEDSPPTNDDPAGEVSTDTESGSVAEGDSKSFEELKDEYDSEESELTGDTGSAAETTEDPAEPPAEDGDAVQTAAPEADAVEAETVAAGAKGERTATDPSAADDGPYLETMPTGYAGDLVVLEWLTDLVAEAGPREARQALSYYASVGWISDAVERDLRTVVDGIADTEAAQREGEGTIDVDDHRRSIATIDRLAGSDTALEHGE